jgi:hypothetical protein
VCTCTEFQHIEFKREAVNKRIKESRSLKKAFTLIAKHPDEEHKLYSCQECGQLWQGSRAWNWGNDEYLFRVPRIEVPQWLEQVFVQPDELLIFTAVMSELLGRSSFVAGEQTCRVTGCERKAVQGLATCLPHHVASLQNAGQFPKDPVGRWFDPYAQEHIVPAL